MLYRDSMNCRRMASAEASAGGAAFRAAYFCCNCARSLILISQKLDDPIMSKRDVAAM